MDSGNSFDFGIDVSSTDTPRVERGTLAAEQPSTDLPDAGDGPYELPDLTGQPDYTADVPDPSSAMSPALPSIAGAALEEVQAGRRAAARRPTKGAEGHVLLHDDAEPPAIDPGLEQLSADSGEQGAQEVGHADAATAPTAKRARDIVSGRAPMVDSEDEADDDAEERPAKRKPHFSPANQRQPSRKPRGGQSQKKQRRRDSEPVSSFRKGPKNKRDENATVEITVQRLVNAPDADAEDELLQSDIPFANRGGETVVDVFAQVCEEIVFENLGKLERTLASTDDDQIKKECRIEMRAITAYKEELNTRLLQHVCAYFLPHFLPASADASRRPFT